MLKHGGAGAKGFLKPNAIRAKRTNGLRVLFLFILSVFFFSTNTLAATPPLVPFDNTGDLYVLDNGSDGILRITPAGAVSVAVTKAQILSAAGGDPGDNISFSNCGIAFDASGNYYFVAANTSQDPNDFGIFRVDGISEVVTLITSEADLSAVSANADPEGMAFGSDGMLYVNDEGSDSVLQVNPTTGAVSVYVSEATLNALGGITNASLDSAIVGAEGGILYTAGDDDDNPPNAIFSVTGGIPTVLASGSPFDDLDVFMTRAPNGDLIIADNSGSDTIHRVTPAGVVSTFLSESALETVTGQDVDLEGGIAFDDAGIFYVADEATDSIWQFDIGLNGSVFVTESAIQAVTGSSPDFEGGIAFAPVVTPAQIPTMNEWGMIFFSLLLAGTAFWFIRRRANAL